MERYQNRIHAGKVLAQHLSQYKNRDDVIVLGLPRGGVPVAYEIAKEINATLDVFIVRKLGVPGHEELAMGAIASGGTYVFNDSLIHDLGITQQEIDKVILQEQKELNRREVTYRGHHAFSSLKDKIIILVDDGIATGATIRAAIKALKQWQPKRLVAAVPVADQTIIEELSELVDEFVCPMPVNGLNAVGAWYIDFSQTEDEEVHACLRG
jgi:predicted phosphoribosyltransferase